jgi:hypothetical protein
MVDADIIITIKRYLASLTSVGIHARRAVLFGSFARGDAHAWSDIDVVVIAPEFDGECNRAIMESLWSARISTDIRIEPIPCGEGEWDTEGGRPILECARREGIVIAAA